MNITEFAEQIVFGTSLEEKLAPPGRLSFASPDESRRSSRIALEAVATLAAPARPLGLEMHDGPGLSQPPADTELENEKTRGRLLHFLANHELLATELMALVLLKFPDAPLAFRRGVLVTLQEEQEHTRLYLQRMRECGIEFGCYPLSGHFWRVVEPMKGPIDFVSRLSLTFEQANLDYSLHYARLFEQIGDAPTSEILHRVYQDEIGHVQHGLHWFRQWKDPHQSDWMAYKSQLDFPMSPQRARGPKCEFNREGREAAGLDAQFIDAVEVYRQSRGRPPVVRWFDAAAEIDLAAPNETNNASRSLTEQLQRDLECLMVWLSNEDDVVLTRDLPTRTFRKQLLELGANLPEFVTWSARDELAIRRLESIEPWAWTPHNERVSEGLHTVVSRQPEWQDSQTDLFRKSWSAERLRSWMHQDNQANFVGSDSCGVKVANTQELIEVTQEFQGVGHERLLFKSDLATSGRSQRLLRSESLLDDRELQWFDRVLQQQPGVVEPELKRVVDLSFLFRQPALASDQQEPIFLGWSRQQITSGRRYAGSYLRRPFSSCSSEVRRFLLANNCQELHNVRNWLARHLAPELHDRKFTGLFGVDALVCQTTDGLRIKPIVELNPRCTMGHIALRLQERIAPTAKGEFRILKAAEFHQLRPRLDAFPLSAASDGRWENGIALLSAPTDKSILVPLVAIGEAARTVISEIAS